MKYFIMGVATGSLSAVRLNQSNMSAYESAMGISMFSYCLLRFGLNPAMEYAAGFGVGYALTQYVVSPIPEENKMETEDNLSAPSP